MSKKLFTSAFIFTLIIVTSIIFLGFHIYGENIKQVNFYNKGELLASSTKSDTSELSEEAKDILSVMKQKIPYKGTYKGTPNYSAQIISDKETITVYFDINTSTDLAVIIIGDDYYTLNNENYLKLANNPLFEEVYYKDALKTNLIRLNDQIVNTNINYKLKYRNELGDILTTKGSHASETSYLNLTSLDNQIFIDSENMSSDISLNVFKGDTILYNKEIEDGVVPIYEVEGELRYVLTETWDETSDKSYFGTVSHEFYINLDLEPSFSIIGGNTKTAGQFYVISAKFIDDDEVPVIETDLTKTNPFFKVGEDYIMIIPLNYYKTKSEHVVYYYVEKDGVKKKVGSDILKITNATFDKQYLNVDQKTTSSTRNDEAYAEYDRVFAPVRENSNSTAYFTGKFQRPCEGRISTEFGMMRYVNGSLTSYRHSGLDIAAKRGTSVKATNTGKVVLSTKLILTGNTVVIDHGVGIFSVYFHMDSLGAKEGEMVQKGQTVGTVGSTGFSTGPHLHFTTSYYKTNINPNYLIDMPEESLFTLY